MFLFEIFARPVPQKQTKWGKRGAYDPSSEDKKTLIWQMRPYAPKEPLLGPVEVDMMFYLPIPKSVSKSMRRAMLEGIVLPFKRPDVDNLAYIITNAMKELFYKDDSQIVDMHQHKRYAEVPKTVVKIQPIG